MSYSVRSQMMGFTVTLAVLGGTTAGFAQTDSERAGAREAAVQGLKAMDEKRWSDAVDLFVRAESIVHAPTVQLYLARSYVALAKLVEAREAYTRLVHAELPSKAPKVFADAQTSGRDELSALDPRVPMLSIHVAGDDATTAVVTLDGVPVPRALVGIASPIDPGPHTLRATTAHAESDSLNISLREAERQSVTLTLHLLEGSQAPAEATHDVKPRDGWFAGVGATQRVAGATALGLGVVALGVGVGFGIDTVSKRNGYKPSVSTSGAYCLTSTCVTVSKEAAQAGNIATASFIAAGVLAASGVALWITAPSKTRTPTALVPVVSPQGGTLVLVGSM